MSFKFPDTHDTGARRFTIFGAGLAGCLLAVYLARLGYQVELYERRPDPRAAGAERGRSINLALSTRGIDALQAAGIAERVLKDAIPMRGRMIHDRAGNLAYQPYGRDNIKAINSVSRSGLNIALLDEAERHKNIRIHFDRRATRCDLATSTVELVNSKGEPAGDVRCDVIIGADGAFSAIRGAMQRTDRFDYSQTYLQHGYKELTIPPSDAPGAGGHNPFRIEKHALHIWPRGDFMMIALPNTDGSFTCTLFWPFEGENSFDRLRTPDHIRAFFEDQFPDAVPLIPDLVEDFTHNPTSSLVTVRCLPWHFGDRVVLIGDACHAIVPFFGQGMNAAFEDCKALAECLIQHPGSDLAPAFAEYERRRKPSSDAIADLAYDNFIEMRDKAGQPAFRRRKAIERFLARILPNWYTPLYERVTFTTEPYHEARASAARQDRIVANVAIIAAGLLLAAIAGVVAGIVIG
ncbi:MAG: FAD-dependent oxidoreductase [Phycisphaerales bacterium]